MAKKIWFKNSKGDKLCGLLSLPKATTDKIAIICHGFSSHKNKTALKSLEKDFLKNKIGFLRFDFYGHGESEGKFENITLSEAVDDVQQAIKLVKNKYKKDKIALIGTSFGGCAAIVASGKSKNLKVLALKAPVSDHLGKIIYKARKNSAFSPKTWKKKGFIEYLNFKGEKLKLNYNFFLDAKKIIEYKLAEKIKVPTLIIHGDKDDVVPVAQSKKLNQIIKQSELIIIKGEKHNFSKKGEVLVKKYIKSFIIKNLWL